MHTQGFTSREDGFSLFELMLVIVVMMIVFGAVFSLMQSSLRSSVANYEMSDAQQALRIAHEAISRDLYSAGDGLIGITEVRVPVAFLRNYVSSQSVATLDPDADGFAGLPLVLSDDNLPANTALLNGPAAFALTGSDRITMLAEDRSFSPLSLAPGAIVPSGETITVAPADIGNFSNGEIYFLSNGTAAALGTVTGIAATSISFSVSDIYGLNQPGAANGFFSQVSLNGTLPTTLKRMRLVHYYLTDSGLLVRRAFGVRGAGHVDSVIAEHIAALNFRYLLNLNDAGGNLRQPVTQLATQQEQNAARQIETTVTAETVKPMLNSGQRATFTASQQITIRNLQFREAQQPTSGVIE